MEKLNFVGGANVCQKTESIIKSSRACCNPSIGAEWGRGITWTEEFQSDLRNKVRLRKERKEREDSEKVPYRMWENTCNLYFPKYLKNIEMYSIHDPIIK